MMNLVSLVSIAQAATDGTVGSGLAAPVAGALTGAVAGVATGLWASSRERRKDGYERALRVVSEITTRPSLSPGSEDRRLGMPDVYATLYLFLPEELVDKVTKYGSDTRSAEYLAMTAEERHRFDREFVDSVAHELWRHSGSWFRRFRKPPHFSPWEQVQRGPHPVTGWAGED